MIAASKAYQAAICADSEKDLFEAQLNFCPLGSVEGGTVLASPESAASRLEQVRSGAANMSARWATCEIDRLQLDGSFALIDDDKPDQQVGFFSAAFSGADGRFASPPYLEYTLDKAYTLPSVSIHFDAPGAEWATALQIEYFDAAGKSMLRKTIANDSVFCIDEWPPDGVKRFKIALLRWNMPFRMAKVAQVLPGQLFLFTPENVYDFSYSECIQPFETALTLPEFKLTFDNADKKFDIVNPKGIMSFLRQKMKLSAKMGIQVNGVDELISMGDFYIASWPDEAQDETASLTCRPSMTFESRSYEAPGTGLQTAYQAALRIFADVSEPVTVDPALSSIRVNEYIGEDVPRDNAMGQLAVACCAYWKFSRNQGYVLTPWQPAAAWREINYDDAWSKPTITQGTRCTSVSVKYFMYDEDKEQLQGTEVVAALEPDDGERKTITSSFIADADRAQAVAQAALAYYNLRLKHSVSYRGDMTIEAGDTVKIENDYAKSDVCVLSHELTFDDNKISGTIKGVGL